MAAGAHPLPTTVEEFADPRCAPLRFQAELEFVQALANPEYLHRAPGGEAARLGTPCSVF